MSAGQRQMCADASAQLKARGEWRTFQHMSASSTQLSVGIVGVGNMGAQMWRRLNDEGVSAVVADASPDAVGALVNEGAHAAPHPAGVASTVDVIVLSLPTSAEVRTVVLGDGGVAAGARPGALVVDTTSGVPSESREIAAALQKKGIGYIDCGVSGGVGGARAGTLKAMIGGDAIDVERARPVLDRLCATTWHCGPVGSGHLVKTLLNQSNQAKLMVELEALIVASKAGLDPAMVADVLDLAVWRQWLFAGEGRQTVGFSLGLACKDFDIALRVAAEERVAAPLAATAQQVLRLAHGLAGPDGDLIDTVSVWEKVAGTTVVARGGSA